MNVSQKTQPWTSKLTVLFFLLVMVLPCFIVSRLSGYDVTMDDEDFPSIRDKTPGHPEVNHTDGVEATSGPLGRKLCCRYGNG